VRVSPLAGLAAAAGFAAVVSAATLAATAAGRPDAVPATGVAAAPATTAAAGATTDTVHVVRFVLVEPSARRVALVGDFNGWAADSTPLMTAGAPGTWTISVTLPAGRHEYAFLVEEASGTVRWMRDPFAPPVRDEYGTESSVVTVGGTVARRS
jgi:1,4-alpha-glucan branching enzyme